MQHKIKTGDNGGKFQHTSKGDRYLLADRKVRTGEDGGHYQVYDGGKKRYLLK